MRLELCIVHPQLIVIHTRAIVKKAHVLYLDILSLCVMEKYTEDC